MGEKIEIRVFGSFKIKNKERPERAQQKSFFIAWTLAPVPVKLPPMFPYQAAEKIHPTHP
ncbi:MAG: hypothetical protein HY890_01255 [Deltaproteobacteria bacterium]|nr:hypothetical protein [Deltaproteobacteria bacterium]